MPKWSHSLDLTVRVCQRKAFLTARYASHSSTKGTPRHEAFLLKKAVDPNTWRGLLVHTVIQEKIIPKLQQSLWPDFNEAREFAAALLDRQLAFSHAGQYRATSKTKAGNDFCILRADLRGTGLTATEIAQVKTEVLHALDTLETQHHDLLERIRRAGLVVSEKEIRFPLDEQILLIAKPDLFFSEHDDRLVIVDWKAVESTHQNARSQLHLYAFAILQSGRWPQFHVVDTELLEVNLLSGTVTSFPLTAEDLDLTDERVFTGTELLRPLFARPTDDCLATDFAPAESPNACAFCSVLEICHEQTLSNRHRPQPVLFECFSA